MKRKQLNLLLSFVSIILIYSCSDSEKAFEHGREFLSERNEAELCPIIPEGYDQNFDETSDCRTSYSEPSDNGDRCLMNADCSEKENGICFSLDMDSCRCYYHECVKDSDCQSGQACVCQNRKPYRICAESCLSSDDCEAGQKCVESSILVGCTNEVLLGETGYRCTSNSDSCTSDYDCPRYNYCVYSSGKGHFICIESNEKQEEGDSCE